ncbi:uncharacterized protein [Miscanthus floridulus]|uniref:uncharacterized protein isoform X1 n=1 Tax=Miscanthus floridulus TaxID=154761 RepID=UPI00345AE883
MDNNYQNSICLDLEKALADESVAPIDLPFWFLKAIAQDFSDDQLIGVGGFGSVYKAVLPNGIIVAVKKLHANKLIEVQEEHFLHEVNCLIEVKHRNIVRFLGYSYETQHMVYPHGGRNVWVDKRNMLFCFEFLSKGSLVNYVTDASSGLEWRVRYQIIKGICEGVAHLHERRIIHMDLKPENILLDDTMAPKITDFGISKRFRENQTKIITGNIVGSPGYMAPEFLRSGTISFGTDIYSLGVIIIQILTGSKECPNVNMVLESWTNTFGTSKSNPPLEQVKLCVEIGIDCMHDDPSKRPHIQDIIRRLNETDISVQLGRFYQYYRQAKQACKPMRIIASMAPELRPCWSSESALLDVHPLELCFPFEAKKVTQCSLNLVNRTHQYFACFIIQQFQDMYAIDQRISYLCPMSTVVLTVKMVRQETPPLDAGMFEILMISMESKDLQNLESSIDNDSQKNDDDLLKRVEELDGEVHAAVLKAVICPPKDPAPKVIWRVGFEEIQTMDVHSTQPWILVGHGKLLSFWYYEMEVTTVFSVDIKDKPENLYRRMIHGHARVTSVRFIPRTEWCVAGDRRGYIHVYTCPTLDEIKSFKATGLGSVKSLAIHPTCPYLLSVSACEHWEKGWACLHVIEIWDWEKGWACCRKVHVYGIAHATFNPMDANTFITSHYYDGVIKVWSINPSADQPITTIRCPGLWRHDHVFTEAAGPNHVVVSGVNRDPQIWDLQTRTRVHTFGHDPRFSRCTAVTCHPTLPLVAVSGVVDFLDNDAHPAVCFWNSTNYRLVKTVWCTSSGKIIYLGFVGSRRLVIGTDTRIEVLEIDMESVACH